MVLSISMGVLRSEKISREMGRMVWPGARFWASSNVGRIMALTSFVKVKVRKSQNTYIKPVLDFSSRTGDIIIRGATLFPGSSAPRLSAGYHHIPRN
jgi:hypothetical protein